jgi:hypothetical protein
MAIRFSLAAEGDRGSLATRTAEPRMTAHGQAGCASTRQVSIALQMVLMLEGVEYRLK